VELVDLVVDRSSDRGLKIPHDTMVVAVPTVPQDYIRNARWPSQTRNSGSTSNRMFHESKKSKTEP
jgi:hypothetical protein